MSRLSSTVFFISGGDIVVKSIPHYTSVSCEAIRAIYRTTKIILVGIEAVGIRLNFLAVPFMGLNSEIVSRQPLRGILSKRAVRSERQCNSSTNCAHPPVPFLLSLSIVGQSRHRNQVPEMGKTHSTVQVVTHPPPICAALLGGSKTTVTLLFPQVGHTRPDSSRDSGKSGPLVR